MAELSRREMLIGTAVGGGAITLMLAGPVVGFLLSPLFTKRRTETAVIGPIDSVPVNTPTPFIARLNEGDGWNIGPIPRVVYVVKYQQVVGPGQPPPTLLVFSNTCTHMQCDVHWDGTFVGAGDPVLNGRFICPCHGGLYLMNGTNIYGPPPSPLPQWVHEVFTGEDGKTYVRIQNDFTEKI